jgi:glycosyltransferase involved in cell wall biosynthesis
MRVLNVVQNFDEETGGGATERALQLSLHLARLGHDVTVLTTGFRLNPAAISALGSVRVIALPCLNSRFFVPVPLLGRISRAVREADVIHLVSHWTLINALTFWFARIHGKPYVVNPLGALPIFGRSGVLKRLYNVVVGTRIIRGANLCVIATPNEIPVFRSYGVDESRIVHIPNGINEEDYQQIGDAGFRARVGVDGHPYILFIGRLNPIKGPDLLMKAFCRLNSRFSDVHLVYIGPDEGMLDSLRKTASEYSMLERVHFLGFVSREDKSRLIHDSRLLVVPSRQEAMSIVVLESGIAGIPVVITDQCGFDEVDTVGGGRVVPATVDGLVRGIEDMLGQGAELARMGGALQTLVQERFLWASVAERYSSLFEQLSPTRTRVSGSSR